MSQPTFYASLLKKYLNKLGLKVEEEVYDGHKHIDLSIDEAKLDIEVDGIHHLTNSKQILTDLERAKHSREDGYETVHIHNMDIKQDVKGIANAIAEVAEKREEDLAVLAGIK